MKKTILLYLVVLGFCSCSEPYEYVETTYSDGSPEIVKYYRSEDKTVLLRKIEYYENGQKRMEGAYKSGKRNGEWTAWYEDGTLWSKGFYDEGVENGMKTVWHPNGQKYYEGPVVNDERTGTWKFWNEEGKLVKEVDYNR